MRCTFTETCPGTYTCTVCGIVVKSQHGNIICQCRPGLGDMVAAGLDSIGITKERVEALVGDCGCVERQAALNELGKKIGIGLPKQPDPQV